MIGLLFLGVACLAAAGGGGYLLHASRKEAQTREKERQELRNSFRVQLAHELRRTKASQFNFSEFVSDHGIERSEANAVAEEAYRGYCQKVFSDGVVSEDERRQMNRLITAFELPPEIATSIERGARDARYQAAVTSALGDGRISRRELEKLVALRRSLGIGRGQGLALTETICRDAFVAEMRRIIRNGRFSPETREDLAKFKRALAISDSDAQQFLTKQAVDLFRECFTTGLQDGVITPAERQMFEWLQAEAGLSESDVAPFWKEIHDAERRQRYRSGHPPIVQTSKFLEGGETCHWNDSCYYEYETSRSELWATGELLVTSKRIVFISPSKSMTFSPSKVLDLILHSDYLEIQTSSRQGNGRYFVGEPRDLEAILSGIVNKHKFLLSENYSSSRTRHIPDSVKRQVWDRDGGRCVRCNAGDYLEFDHIIPHARGGANTVGNVQLLCRKCNNQKSDRI